MYVRELLCYFREPHPSKSFNKGLALWHLTQENEKAENILLLLLNPSQPYYFVFVPHRTGAVDWFHLFSLIFGGQNLRPCTRVPTLSYTPSTPAPFKERSGYVVQDGLGLSMYFRPTLNSQSLCLHLLRIPEYFLQHSTNNI